MSDIEQTKKETMLATTYGWIKKLSAFADASNLKFSDYQKEIVVNTVRKIQEQGHDIYSFDTNNVADVLYQTAFLNLNPSASPRHCYFMTRDVWENGKKVGQKIEVNIEGEGNDEILRKFGVGIKRDANGEAVGIGKVMIISEYDEYQDGAFNGFDFEPPTWIRKPTPIGKKKGRVIKVIYPIERSNGKIEYWGAERADLQPIILKHIEKNLMGYSRAKPDEYRKLMKELKNLSFDEIIEQHEDTEIKWTHYNKDYSVRLIQDAYTGSTGEAMIIRKLRNLAIRTFPKNFDQTAVQKIYESTFEERYDKPSIAENAQVKLDVEKQQEASVVEVQDDVEEDIVTIIEEPKRKKVTQKKETQSTKSEENNPTIVNAEVSDTNEIDEDLDDIFKL